MVGRYLTVPLYIQRRIKRLPRLKDTRGSRPARPHMFVIRQRIRRIRSQHEVQVTRISRSKLGRLAPRLPLVYRIVAQIVLRHRLVLLFSRFHPLNLAS